MLKDIGAISETNEDSPVRYEITPLGIHLARLPLDVRLGKMLIYACLFDCLGPLLTVAATLGGKTPLMSPLDCKEAAALAHARFSTHNHPSFTVPVARSSSASQLSKSPYFPFSDHLTVVRAFDQWNSVRLKDGKEAAFEFCRTNFLSSAVLEDILDIRAQFRSYLSRANLLPNPTTPVPPDETENDEDDHTLLSSPRTHSEDLVRCALCAGRLSPSPSSFSLS
jgi:ATP-dependent RNA helicase DHX57